MLKRSSMTLSRQMAPWPLLDTTLYTLYWDPPVNVLIGRMVYTATLHCPPSVCVCVCLLCIWGGGGELRGCLFPCSAAAFSLVLQNQNLDFLFPVHQNWLSSPVLFNFRLLFPCSPEMALFP